MNHKKNKISTSLRKIQYILLALLVPIMVTAAGFILYSFLNAYTDNANHFVSSVEVQTDECGDLLIRMNYYLFETLMTGEQINKMESSDSIIDRNNAARTFQKEMDYVKNFWTKDFELLYYNTENMVLMRTNSIYNYNHAVYMKEFLISAIEANEVHVNIIDWKPIVIDNELYLYQLYKSGKSYFGSWIPCDILFKTMRSNTLGEKGKIYYLNENSEPILRYTDDDGSLISNPIETQGFDEMHAIFPLERSGITLYVTTQNSVDINNLALMLTFIIVVLIIILLVSMYSLSYYRRYIETPLRSFEKHISEYAELRQNTRRQGFLELNHAVEAFDNLQTQLKELKIDIYEEQLAVSRVQLEYYQLQIKPHFFVNCFTIIHAMAQKKDYIRIQEFCIKLSNYVRYLLNGSFSKVTLQDELNIINEFLDIQRIRKKDTGSVTNTTDESLLEMEIPPLIILTFVENSVKHGNAGNTPVTVEVLTEKKYTDTGTKAIITIEDNGVGMPEEIIEFYSSGMQDREDWKQDEHIGIRNIMMRLHLFYGDNFELSFVNTNRGAKVEIVLPLVNPDESIHSPDI